MFLFEIPPDKFYEFSRLAHDVLSDGDSDPTFIIKCPSKAYDAFRKICLEGGATQPIMWQVPDSGYDDPQDAAYGRELFFGDMDQDSWTISCDSREPFDKILAMNRPASVLAVLHGACVIIELDKK